MSIKDATATDPSRRRAHSGEGTASLIPLLREAAAAQAEAAAMAGAADEEPTAKDRGQAQRVMPGKPGKRSKRSKRSKS